MNLCPIPPARSSTSLPSLISQGGTYHRSLPARGQRNNFVQNLSQNRSRSQISSRDAALDSEGYDDSELLFDPDADWSSEDELDGDHWTPEQEELWADVNQDKDKYW